MLNRDINRLLRETSVASQDRLRPALNTAAAVAPPFGNNPAKIERYQAFWNRSSVSRPLVGFSLVGWFPMQEFQACQSWSCVDHLTPGMIDPQAFIEDHLTLLREGELVDDDLMGEIQCFQINKDALGPSTAAMIPHYRKVQSAGKPLLIRGSFGAEETRLLLDSLDPRGLFLNIMVESVQAVESLRPLVGM